MYVLIQMANIKNVISLKIKLYRINEWVKIS